MPQSRPFSRRYLLGSSALALVSGATLAGSVRAAPKDDPATSDDVTDLNTIAKTRGNKKKGKKPPKAAMIRDFDRNPHLSPQGPPLSPAEQAQYKQAITATGRGL
jgi:hypothetical protein